MLRDRLRLCLTSPGFCDYEDELDRRRNAETERPTTE